MSQDQDSSLFPPFDDPLVQSPRRSSEGYVSSTGVAGGSSSVAASGGSKGSAGIAATGTSSKKQTVLGAGKAAVSGVFGKFRKSVG